MTPGACHQKNSTKSSRSFVRSSKANKLLYTPTIRIFILLAIAYLAFKVFGTPAIPVIKVSNTFAWVVSVLDQFINKNL